MKDSEFSHMVMNAPEGATHYRRRQRSVTFYRDIDNEHGSYASVSWWTGEKEAFGEWYTRRSFLDLSKVLAIMELGK